MKKIYLKDVEQNNEQEKGKPSVWSPGMPFEGGTSAMLTQLWIWVKSTHYWRFPELSWNSSLCPVLRIRRWDGKANKINWPKPAHAQKSPENN